MRWRSKDRRDFLVPHWLVILKKEIRRMWNEKRKRRIEKEVISKLWDIIN